MLRGIKWWVSSKFASSRHALQMLPDDVPTVIAMTDELEVRKQMGKVLLPCPNYELPKGYECKFCEILTGPG